MHDWLPVNKHMAKIYRNHSALCPYCNEKEESWQHLYKCTNDTAQAAKDKTLLQFKSDLVKLKTAPLIKSVLVQKLAQWMGLSLDAPSIPDDNLGQALRAAISEQHDLCWDNFFKGRTSLRWKEAQQYHIQTFHASTPNTKDKWAKGLISAIWRVFTQLWISRCNHMHGKKYNIDPSHLDPKIRHAYRTLAHNLSTSDRHLFNTPLKKRLKTCPVSKLHWLDAVNLAATLFRKSHNIPPTQLQIQPFLTTTHNITILDPNNIDHNNSDNAILVD